MHRRWTMDRRGLKIPLDYRPVHPPLSNRLDLGEGGDQGLEWGWGYGLRDKRKGHKLTSGSTRHTTCSPKSNRTEPPNDVCMVVPHSSFDSGFLTSCRAQ